MTTPPSGTGTVSAAVALFEAQTGSIDEPKLPTDPLNSPVIKNETRTVQEQHSNRESGHTSLPDDALPPSDDALPPSDDALPPSNGIYENVLPPSDDDIIYEEVVAATPDALPPLSAAVQGLVNGQQYVGANSRQQQEISDIQISNDLPKQERTKYMPTAELSKVTVNRVHIPSVQPKAVYLNPTNLVTVVGQVEETVTMPMTLVDTLYGKHIAAQRPTRDSERDFFQVILRKNISLISDLSNDNDVIKNIKRNNANYFPTKVDETIKYGDICVRCLSRDEKNYSSSEDDRGQTVETGHIETRLEITEQGKPPKEVIHLGFRAWPDHGVPSDESRNQFDVYRDRLNEVRKTLNYPKELTHCLVGVGRTFTKIMMDDVDAAIHSKQFDTKQALMQHLLQRLHYYRTQRSYTVVQTPAQFEMIQQYAEQQWDTAHPPALPPRAAVSAHQNQPDVTSASTAISKIELDKPEYASLEAYVVLFVEKMIRDTENAGLSRKFKKLFQQGNQDKIESKSDLDKYVNLEVTDATQDKKLRLAIQNAQKELKDLEKTDKQVLDIMKACAANAWAVAEVAKDSSILDKENLEIKIKEFLEARELQVLYNHRFSQHYYFKCTGD